MPKTRKTTPAIEVENAWTHNLKGVTCRVPHGAVTVVTGPSGAGKSSLAFDTIYAEGQRRFVESMSTYVQQFLEQMERPPVDELRNILPSVALEAKNAIRNARSTVGTITEANDVLRLLFTHLGEVLCPEGHGPMRRYQPEQVAEALDQGEVGERFNLLVRLPRPKNRANDVLQELIRQGFMRRLGEDGPKHGTIERMKPGARWLKKLDPLPLVLGRFTAKGTGEISPRLVETIEQGYSLGGGRLEALEAGGGSGEGEGDHELPGTAIWLRI